MKRNNKRESTNAGHAQTEKCGDQDKEDEVIKMTYVFNRDSDTPRSLPVTSEGKDTERRG